MIFPDLKLNHVVVTLGLFFYMYLYVKRLRKLCKMEGEQTEINNRLKVISLMNKTKNNLIKDA